MASQPEPIILTYDDLQTMPEDGNRYELFEGDIEVTPSPIIRHQRVVTNLSHILNGHVREHHLGTVLVGPTDVVVSPITVMIPDLLFVSTAREAIIHERFINGAPDLVVEVLSPSTAERDRRSKKNLYARYGIPHHWLIDAAEQVFETYDLSGTAYVLSGQSQGSGVLVARPFLDLSINLGQVW
ncbi:MAG TPA: Uma2 family endonuclease [Chloroflexota bacterium]|nr:Uma2 family endonuclease [Chloroflexota bacterium]